VETSGAIIPGRIDTALLDKPMRYIVYLPPCYAAETEKHYPVLYLLHGQNYDEGQWLRIGAAKTADRLISARELPPFIIVMPYDYSFKQPSEYKFEQVLIEMLLPRIDQTYRTLPEKAQRALGGLSRGGAWAIHLGLRHPDLFGAIGAHSPAIFYSDMETMRIRLRDADKEHFPRLFLDAGDHDSNYDNIVAYESLLNENDIPHEWHPYIGFHEEKYWSAHVEEYLRWYAAAWK
jgi:enterochelin esterase-like enzyme